MTSDSEHDIAPAGIVWCWDMLRREVGESQRTYELKGTPVEGTFLICLVDGELPGILVAIEPDDKVPVELSGRNIRLQDRTIRLGLRNQRMIEISCRDPALEMPFSELVVGVYRRIMAGRQGCAAVAAALGEFRELLERPSGKEVSREQAAGMAGEMLVLKWLLGYSASAWRFWEGPTGGTWDFRARGTAIEVKTALRPGQQHIQIHGLYQLDQPSGGLSLAYLTLIPDAAGSVSVPALADELAQMVDNREKFNELLFEGGYEPARREAWERHRFEFTQHFVFRVDDEFPALTLSRLKEERMPVGVDSVSYSVSLDVARNWLVSSDQEEKIFRELASA